MVLQLYSPLRSSPLEGAMVAGSVYGEASWQRFQAANPRSIRGAAAAFYPLISVVL